MCYKTDLKKWAIENDPVSNLVTTCHVFDQMCGNNTWMTTDEDESVVAEAAYNGLIMRRFDGARWQVKLLHRGRTYLQ